MSSAQGAQSDAVDGLAEPPKSAPGAFVAPKKDLAEALPEVVAIDPLRSRELKAQEVMADTSIVMAAVAAITFMVTSIGTWLIWGQVRLTRKAVEETAKATVMMEAQNATAREAMQRQLRAYLQIEPGGVNAPDDGQVRLPYTIKNCGQTPAYNLAVWGDVLIMATSREDFHPRDFDPSSDGRKMAGDAWSDITLGPGHSMVNYAYQPESLFEPFYQDIHLKKSAILHYGYVDYDDCFGRRHRTNFAYYHWGDELTDANTKRCARGNGAT